MKYLIFSTALVLGGCYLPSALTDEQARQLEKYELLIDLPGHSADELYVRVNTWVVENFNNADAVIEFRDKEAGVISGKYVQLMTRGLGQYYVRSTITIQVREGRVKFKASQPSAKPITNPAQNYHPIHTSEGAEKVLTAWHTTGRALGDYLAAGEEEW